jgi:hypothetical protein
MQMLGEPIGEDRGKITARRVLRSDRGDVKVEVTCEASGKLLGMDVTELVTYWSTVQPNGLLYGEGQGIFMTSQGESVQWTGAGRGHFTEQGGVSFRGSVFCQTTSERLSRLNGVAVLFEHESDRDGNVVTQYWEWK